MKTKKLICLVFIVIAVLASTFAVSPKGNTICCALSATSPCNVLVPDKAISLTPTGETGYCAPSCQEQPCPLVYIVDQP